MPSDYARSGGVFGSVTPPAGSLSANQIPYKVKRTEAFAAPSILYIITYAQK